MKKEKGPPPSVSLFGKERGCDDDPALLTYPRGQSYHDLAVRLEPIILELEREQNDLLIIAHESVLRVLYAYLMHCSTMDIPKLKFPRDEIIEIIPAAYQNEAKRVHIPGLDPNLVPGSPEDIKIPVPQSGGIYAVAGGGGGSGNMSPMPGLSSPAEPQTATGAATGAPAASGTPVPSGTGVESPLRPPEKVVNTAADMVADKVADED